MALNRYEVLETLKELLAAQDAAKPAASQISHVSSKDHASAEPLKDCKDQVLDRKPSASHMLLTVPEACAELRVSRAQLYILTNKQRVIEMIHIGKLARIPRASLEAYVQQLRQHQRPATRLAFDNELCA